MADKPRISDIRKASEHLAPQTENVEEFLHSQRGKDVTPLLRAAAWEADESKAVEKLIAACRKEWPKYYGQTDETHFANVDWSQLLESERGHAKQFQARSAALQERLASGDDAWDVLDELVRQPAQLAPDYDRRLLDVASEAVYAQAGTDITLGESPLKGLLDEMDHDDSFETDFAQTNVRIGRVIFGPDAGDRYRVWKPQREGFEVHGSEDVAREHFDDMHRDLAPRSYHQDMHEY